MVEDVARRAALAIDNARIHAERRTVARALQRSLLPPRLPKVEGIEFGAEYVPTGEAVDVGGDFYDVVPLSDRRWLVVVGDVSGKGVQAATVTGLVRDVTRVLVRDGRPLPEVLNRLNETLVERGGGRFCTLCLAAVSRRSDNLLDVTLHLAGHDQPVLVHADGSTAVVGTNGTALGLLDTIKCPATEVPLGPGDTLIFYTDGVTERRRGARAVRRGPAAAGGSGAGRLPGRGRGGAAARGDTELLGRAAPRRHRHLRRPQRRDRLRAQAAQRLFDLGARGVEIVRAEQVHRLTRVDLEHLGAQAEPAVLVDAYSLDGGPR